MKKYLVIGLVIAMVFALAACGGRSSGNNGKVDAGDIAENMIEDAIEGDAFSEKAAAQALKMKGIDEADVAPDWDWRIDESLMMAYGDTSHGTITFIKKDGEVSSDDYTAWLKKVFNATAKASDDGHNIQGFSFGNGDVEKTWDEFINGEGFIQTWSYKYKGTIMDVYVEQVEDPEKESEMITNADGKWEMIYYYYAVNVDIATGLQKSFDETMEDLEKAFEEHGDEIEAALRDYAN